MSLVILFHFLCAQHDLDINISIIRSLRLFLLNYHFGIIVLVLMCVAGLVSVLQALACNTDTTPIRPH